MTAPIEPSADLRKFASMLRQMYIALTSEGFSNTEAFAIVAEIIRANIGGSST
jgi:uncharacterized protein YoaH (UPF0181 family)